MQSIHSFNFINLPPIKKQPLVNVDEVQFEVHCNSTGVVGVGFSGYLLKVYHYRKFPK